MLLQLRVCARNNIEETKKIDSVYIFFFFRFLSTIRYDWPGLLICYPVCRFCCSPALDRFSIPTPSTSSLCGETTRTTSWRIVLPYFSWVKVSTASLTLFNGGNCFKRSDYLATTMNRNCVPPCVPLRELSEDTHESAQLLPFLVAGLEELESLRRSFFASSSSSSDVSKTLTSSCGVPSEHVGFDSTDNSMLFSSWAQIEQDAVLYTHFRESKKN